MNSRPVSKKRLQRLIDCAERHSKPWLGVDVVQALQELQHLDERDPTDGTRLMPKDRLQQLIEFAQQSRQPWLAVDVVQALEQLQHRRNETTSPDGVVKLNLPP